MNKIFFILILGLTSCVPLREYKARVAELEELSVGNKALRKQIKLLEKENIAWLDTIHRRIERANKLSEKIKKSLAAKNIKSEIDAAKLKGIAVRDPFNDEWVINWNKEHNYHDTNSAKNTAFLKNNEKRIYYYLNWARENPKDFCKRFILPLLKRDSNNVYVLTLIDYMYKMLPMNSLKPSQRQFNNAKCHAETSGKIGFVGHERKDKSCKKEFGGECISYGVSDPLGVIVQLLVDNGTPSLGHRYICLGFYTEVGISVMPHTVFGVNTVMDFK